MLEIVTVVGARPQFIKAATVSRAIATKAGQLRERIVHTGQHYDAGMSDVFFSELEIPRPHMNLGVGSGSHGTMTGRQLEGIERVLESARPDWVLVYGDTNSTLAGALAAAKLNIPVAHVESGLRSWNRQMPEEINRIVTDHVADLLFTPTATATSHLLREGVDPARIDQSGDVMYDAARYYAQRAREPQWMRDLGPAESDFVLCTLHRPSNTDDRGRMNGILKGLLEARMPVILPAHPRTRSVLESFDLDGSRVNIVDPVSYLEMTFLLHRCQVVITDSGGLQKEAYFSGKPCITVRDETEWVELVDLGVNQLVAAEPSVIADAVRSFRPVVEPAGIFGSGDAAMKIVDRMLSG